MFVLDIYNIWSMLITLVNTNKVKVFSFQKNLTIFTVNILYMSDSETVCVGSGFCVLRADVLPSQRRGLTTSPYDAWVYVHRDLKYILTAHAWQAKSHTADTVSSWFHLLLLITSIHWTNFSCCSRRLCCNNIQLQPTFWGWVWYEFDIPG